ncbi:MAG: hypothetical protein A2V66_11670 [Ignavibacteria bacterium RBG_13_36_8]|nr:MAG: hypothetical protein A2V66_11670 [Ignavibacteria bacterium RBG_13_36_8]
MNPTEITTPKDIKNFATAFQKSRVLLTAVELDLFTVLDGHLLTSSDVAKKINSDARATDRLMNALVALGFLRKTQGKFYNTVHTNEFLITGKPNFMGGLMHTAHLWKTWNTLTDAVRKGGSVYEREINNRGENWLEAFIAAMHYRAIKQAKIIAMMIDLNNVNTLLDIGGGSGAFSIGFINTKNNTKATILDLPNVIPITKKYIEQEKLSDKIEYIEGNYLTADFKGPYDLTFLSAIIHINSFEENKKLIQKCAGSLNPKGKVVVLDQIMNEDRTIPENGALFALNMLVGTEHGDTYTKSEICSWMKDADLTCIEKKETGFGSALMLGIKK